jgi:glycosyltransferase involved in cell wall biosynthesis
MTKGLSCAVKHKCYRDSRVQTLACVISTLIHRGLGTYGKLNYICLTEFNKEKLLNLKQIKEKRVFVKPNFVSTLSENEKKRERKKQFVYAGRLDELKGVDFLLKAWSKLENPELKLVLCGVGPLEDWCKEYIADHQLDNVEMKGFVSNQDVKKILSESTALILPTRWYEGFPMTILEAFSVGTPVIGSDMGNVGNLIIEEINGSRFSPGNEAELLQAIKKIHPDHERVLQYFEETYSPETNYEKLKNIYGKVTAT